MDDQISQFVAITGASADEARHLLEASGGDVNEAVAHHFEGDAGPSPGPLQPPSQSQPQQAQAQSATPFGSAPEKKRFATVRDVAGGEDPGPEDDESQDDDKDPQNYFAGGGRSGLSVQDPNKRQRGPDRLVQDLLKKAAQSNRPPPDEPEQRPAEKEKDWFSGSGNTLGSDEAPSQLVPGEPENPGPSPSSRVVMPGGFDYDGDDEDGIAGGGRSGFEEETVTRTLTFWRNGFSIEDGPLMTYDDPANQEALNALNSGRAPLSLLKVKFGQRVDVRVSRRMDEDYQSPPPKPAEAFSGSGNRLGSTSMPVVSTPPLSTQQPKDTGGGGGGTDVSGDVSFEIDQSKPKTQLQIRLGDGERMVAQFNHTHTIADVRRYINASRPGNASRPYNLMTTFPSKELSDASQTLADANILGSVIVQRWQ